MVLTYGARDLTLSIADDGHGFDHAEVQQDPRRGIGLRMRERMAALSGTLHSGAQGTLLKAWLPLPGRATSSPTHDA